MTKFGYSRFISRLGESKMMSREHKDSERGELEKKYSHFYYFSVHVVSTKVFLIGDTIFASPTNWKRDCILYVFIRGQANVY